MSHTMDQAWQEETLALPPGERLIHWVKAAKQVESDVWILVLICRPSIVDMQTTRAMPWRGPEEVNCLYCIVHPKFVWAQ